MSTGASNTSSAGASVGQKVKGAFQTVHGLGESIRGNAMDFVDSTLGTERAGHNATVKGQQETEVGVSNMEGHAAVGTAPMQGVTQAAPTTTQTAPTTAGGTGLGADVKGPPGSGAVY